MFNIYIYIYIYIHGQASGAGRRRIPESHPFASYTPESHLYICISICICIMYMYMYSTIRPPRGASRAGARVAAPTGLSNDSYEY